MTDNDSKIIKEAHNHAVLILASGLSQRLGQSKQLLMRKGTPLISHMLSLALATDPVLVVVVIPEQETTLGSMLRQAIDELVTQHTSIQIVANSRPKAGMAQSLTLGVDALRTRQHIDIDRVLIMSVDQVLLDTHHLQQLLIRDDSKDNGVVVASRYPHLDTMFALDMSKKSIIGVPLVLDYDLLKMRQPSLNGDKGLRYLIRTLTDEQISTVIQSQLSYDIDTPEQLAYARQQGWLDPCSLE